jgi:hypothetical protein
VRRVRFTVLFDVWCLIAADWLLRVHDAQTDAAPSALSLKGLPLTEGQRASPCASVVGVNSTSCTRRAPRFG